MLETCKVGDLVQVSCVRDIIFTVNECSDKYKACIHVHEGSGKNIIMQYSDLTPISVDDALLYIKERKKELSFNMIPEQLKKSKLETLDISLKEINKCI